MTRCWAQTKGTPDGQQLQQPRAVPVRQDGTEENRQRGIRFPAHLRHGRARTRLLHPRRLRHTHFPRRRLLRQHHRADHRHDRSAAVAGYFGGRVDLFIMRIVDIIYSLPDMLVIILLAVVLEQVLRSWKAPSWQKIGSNIISMFIVFGLLYWVGMARLIRGQILSLTRAGVRAGGAARSGAKARLDHHASTSCRTVIQRHHYLRRRCRFRHAIFTESFLSFLGLGVNAPMPSLGSLANCRARAASADLSL